MSRHFCTGSICDLRLYEAMRPVAMEDWETKRIFVVGIIGCVLDEERLERVWGGKVGRISRTYGEHGTAENGLDGGDTTCVSVVVEESV